MTLELRSFCNGSYPNFVTSSSPLPIKNQIPVFMFHSVKPRVLEKQLRFLAENGYRTLTCDEYYEMIVGKVPILDKSVLLTIDDGKSSVWVYAYPLLKKFGFKAAVFLIPGYMSDSGERSPNLDDLWEGKNYPDGIRDRDRSFTPLLTWDEVKEMNDSDIIDFQCHTLYHHKIYIAEKVLDFFHPECWDVDFNVVVPKDYEDHVKENKLRKLYGMPIFENDSLMSAKPRYLNSSRLTKMCVEHVSSRGGEEFFTRPFWRNALYKIVSEFNETDNELQNRYESKDQTKDEIYCNLYEAKELIQKKLPGKEVRHLCFPYGIGSSEAVEQSQKAGYVTNFWTTIPWKSSNKPGDDPYYSCRLKDDYIFRLPGKKRQPLRQIFLQKLSRRFSNEPLY